MLSMVTIKISSIKITERDEYAFSTLEATQSSSEQRKRFLDMES